MRYMQTGNFRTNPLMRLTLIASLIFFCAFWITTALMFVTRLGLTPESVAAYYRGSEAAFTQPRTFSSMLEVTHGHLPVMALVALVLTHLYIFTPFSTFVKYSAIITFFAAAFFGEVASWLVRYVNPGFAYLKISAFVILEFTMAWIIYGLFRLLILQPPFGRKLANGHSSNGQKPKLTARGVQ